MYTKIEIKSIEHFTESSYFMKYLSQDAINTLCVFDVDGVLFTSLADIRTYTSKISEKRLTALAKIARTDAGMWIFTDRACFGEWGPYKEQITYALKKNPSFQEVYEYDDPATFIKEFDFTKHRRSMIFNAKKPSIIAQNVIKLGLMNYRQVLYFAAQDIPWTFRDEDLVKKLNEREDTDRLTFISIK